MYNQHMSLLTALQTVLAVLLVILIIMQNRGAGLGSSWGGSGELYVTRRGIEKLLFRLTILTSILFAVVSFVSFLN